MASYTLGFLPQMCCRGAADPHTDEPYSHLMGLIPSICPWIKQLSTFFALHFIPDVDCLQILCGLQRGCVSKSVFESDMCEQGFIVVVAAHSFYDCKPGRRIIDSVQNYWQIVSWLCFFFPASQKSSYMVKVSVQFLVAVHDDVFLALKGSGQIKICTDCLFSSVCTAQNNTSRNHSFSDLIGYTSV